MHQKIKTALQQNNIKYKEHLHTNYSTEINNPADFANALGYIVERITKSILIRSADRKKYAMAVCSANKKLDFSELARHLSCKKVEVASKEDLYLLIGYPINGVSPIGLENIPVLMDSALLKFETILIGGGAPKVEVEISPLVLQKVSKAFILPITL